MKNYQKPQATITAVTNSNTIANAGLTGWLSESGLDNGNITTYVMMTSES